MNDGVISTTGTAIGYLMLLIPFAVLLWYKTGLGRVAMVAMIRMTVQLLFVGFYLQFVFARNHWGLNLAWLLVMIAVADGAILQRCDLRIKRLGLEMFVALFLGTLIPLGFFVGAIITIPNLLDARYLIPIGGMILGNCLRSNVVGLRGFYQALRKRESEYLYSLSQGASRSEAIRPFIREALQDAFAPALASFATIGLVSLPGMMTGVILAGADPINAILYQISIIIAIFTGTAITVWIGIVLTGKRAFTSYGILDKKIFK